MEFATPELGSATRTWAIEGVFRLFLMAVSGL